CKIIFLVASASLLALANRIGNGGNVVVCKDSIEVLDFYEASTSIKFPVNSQHLDYQAIAEDVFKRLKSVSPKLSSQYLERLKTIVHEIEFKDGVALTDVKDSFHAFKPEDKNCEVK